MHRSELSGRLDRQRDAKDCPALAHDIVAPIFDRAAMTLNNLSYDPEAEPVAFGFAALEGVEQSLPECVRDPFSIIGNRNDHIWVTHRHSDVEISGMG